MPSGVLSARSVRSSDGAKPKFDAEDVDLSFRRADFVERFMLRVDLLESQFSLDAICLCRSTSSKEKFQTPANYQQRAYKRSRKNLAACSAISVRRFNGFRATLLTTRFIASTSRLTKSWCGNTR